MSSPSPSDLDILARTLYGEARGEGKVGLRAVAHTIMNRVKDDRWPDKISVVCRQAYQFSCWNERGDQSQLRRLGDLPFDELVRTKSYLIAVAVALDEDDFDPTGGANHYLTTELFGSDKRPSWADPGKVTATIKNHIFLKL